MASVNLDKSIKNTPGDLDCNYLCRSQNAFENFSKGQQVFTVVGIIALVAIVLVVLSYCFFPQLQRLLGRPNRQRPEYLEGQDPEELGEGSSSQVRFREPEVTATYTEARGGTATAYWTEDERIEASD
ncbi:hypothetical protein LTS08_008174 [Lithohypha guttulata]|uniref:Uncharacterized protein n=1 Tax=Lithohypha guttulata TaxID=1690604 RepID=A0AAN7T2Y7_9EURO|nr:hypothetical protein LTR51_006181 [Lithohypha guttulata]KAK5088385.1 hypothetical protein LTR05_002603 [Lithohypha guttulata]KAK5095275.1 hypothetical protein LTS08_008174 [Lithohypha guttulata]